MSSWAPYPPPPRRSRSRSPPRGGYSGRQYNDTYPDYRQDWDNDRERWYGRDYEYGRRGRSRSPADEVGRKRRRSMSPSYERERYEPRARYGDDYDGHSRYPYSTSPRRHAPGYGSAKRPPPDPRTFEYPASLKQYADWFRYFYPSEASDEDAADKQAEQEAGDGSKPRNGIKTRWEKYKKEFAAVQLQTMFDHHRKSPWFAEKYDPAPEYETLRTRVRKEGWKHRLNNFLHDLEAGKFDPDLHESEAVDGSSLKDSATNGDAAPSEANGVGADEHKPQLGGGDDEMQFTADADEDNVDPDASRIDANGKATADKTQNGRGEEIAVPPEGNQVMIRTIPPDIGRVKLEEACCKIPGFIYLALGDPLQKRNYYRAGWLRFKDDADMTAVMTELTEKKIEGFKLHVTHNLKPFINKVRYTPEVASRPDRLEKDLANAKTLAALLEVESARVRTAKVPVVGTPLKALKEGDEDNSQAPSDTAMDMDEDEDSEPAERGSDAVERRVEKIMSDLREQGQVDPNDEKAYEARKTVVSLDMYLAYLRAAFHTCYYCAVVTDHLEELQRKCLKHVRKPLSRMILDEMKSSTATAGEGEKKQDQEGVAMEEDGDEKEKQLEREKQKDSKQAKNESKDFKRNDERWLDWLDSKIALLIDRNGVDPRAYGGKSYDEELSKTVESYIKQEDEGKFRCKTCQKLFKATPFVEKHIANKHPDLVKGLEELPYFNNFALDPHRIQPLVHPPTNPGNSTQAPPQAYGIQPPTYHSDYGRGGAPYYPGAGSYPPPPGGGYGGWDYYGGGPAGPGYGPPPSYPPPPPRREENSRRLSDRIGSGYASVSSEPSVIPAGAGLPPKPPPAALDAALSAGNTTNRRPKNTNSGQSASGPPPPPPPDAKEDPRAAAGKRVSYHDMDLVAEGDVELMY